MTNTGPIDLSTTPIHIGSVAQGAQGFEPLEWFGFDGESFGKYVTEHCSNETPGRLVMMETMVSDWPTWERHTEGDELVIVVEGAGIFHQEIEGQCVSSPFRAGDTFLNPKGVWHTADVVEPMRAVYITPCPGTENKPRG
ncbi:MAG: cupin domain-containing protein [Halioglobus sp.]